MYRDEIDKDNFDLEPVKLSRDGIVGSQSENIDNNPVNAELKGRTARKDKVKVSGCEPKISCYQAIKNLTEQMMVRRTCEEGFKTEFINKCTSKNVQLVYFPYVVQEGTATSAKWTGLESKTSTTGYRVTITGSEASGYTGEVHEDTTTDWSLEDIEVKLDVKDKEVCADERINKIVDTEIVEISIPMPDEQDAKKIESLKYKAWENLDKKLKERSKKERNLPQRAKVSTQKDETRVIYYPMYLFCVKGIYSYVNGIDGSVVLNYEKGGSYQTDIATMKKKDILPKTIATLVMATVIVFMIYTLVRVIILEVESWHIYDPNMYDSELSHKGGYAAIIGGNILVCLVWGGYVFLRAFLIADHGLYLNAYLEWEKEERQTSSFTLDRKRVFKYCGLLAMTIIWAAVLIIIYISISSIFVVDGFDGICDAMF